MLGGYPEYSGKTYNHAILNYMESEEYSRLKIGNKLYQNLYNGKVSAHTITGIKLWPRKVKDQFIISASYSIDGKDPKRTGMDGYSPNATPHPKGDIGSSFFLTKEHAVEISKRYKTIGILEKQKRALADRIDKILWADRCTWLA